jgi:hypothetical protein
MGSAAKSSYHATYAQSPLGKGLRGWFGGAGAALSITGGDFRRRHTSPSELSPSPSMFLVGEMICKGIAVFGALRRAGIESAECDPFRSGGGNLQNSYW